MTIDLILGTAGHIDHGKTSLIRALTGVNTDRLPEEKKRGITIELGFAELSLGDYRLGIVDVPGHERFVRNMLAGATGMDLAMLVVAADDSIKQQTREHLDILRILDLRVGVIALTKTDLVEDDWLDLVEDEIRGLVQGTFLEDAPIVRVSSKTGAGIEALRGELLKVAATAVELGRTAAIEAPFRLAIDRTFTMAGHGTIVTGSVVSGKVSVGDDLKIQPGDISVRVRSLQNHDRSVEQVHRGQRAAINLTGVHHDQTERGHELAANGFLIPSRILNVRLQLLSTQKKPLKDRKRVRLHVGTAEILSTVRLLDRELLEPGESCFAQLFLQSSAVTTWNQPIVLRSESPVTTIGGGQVSHPDADRIRQLVDADKEMLQQSIDDDPIKRAESALYFAGFRGWDPNELPRTAGVVEVDSTCEALIESKSLVELPISPTRRFRLHRLRLEQIADRIESVLNGLHDRYPLRTYLDRTTVRNAFLYLPEVTLFDAAIEWLKSTKQIQTNALGIALKGRGPKLSQNEQKLLAQLVTWFDDGGMEPPTVEQCKAKATKNKDAVPQLIGLAVANGDLVEIGSDLYFHRKTDQWIRDTVSTTLTELDEGATMSEIRDALGTTRKYAVPICEYLDRIGVTRRDGDVRRLADPSSVAMQSDAST